MKLRIKFTKSYPMIFIGHLDIMRYFQKAMRRAEIDISYTQGFNPHQVMSFAAPLGVGMYSKGEYLDISVESVTTEEDMVNRLNAVMVEGITIEHIRILEDNTKPAMASVASAAYTLTYREGYELPKEFHEKFVDYMSQEHLMVTKTTKKSTLELDLKPAIYEYNVLENGFYLFVDASSSGNIKPTLVMQGFYDYLKQEYSEFTFVVTREDTYLAIPEGFDTSQVTSAIACNGKFGTLDCIGKKF